MKWKEAMKKKRSNNSSQHSCMHIIEKIQNQSAVADGDLIQFSPFFFWEQGLNYSPLGALGAKAIEAAIMAKRRLMGCEVIKESSHVIDAFSIGVPSISSTRLRTSLDSTTDKKVAAELVSNHDPVGGYSTSRIRNFSIIAHIDHGKSTLADRLLESTQTVSARDMQSQLLDNLDLERERGITIKLQAARVLYKSKEDGQVYMLNLIDTPGHVDFSYEVSRSLAACEGALLVVDASQGIEAQTLANVYLALENDLEIIPVLNKIDLPAADPDRVKDEIEETIGLDCENIVRASAKSGIGIEDILESIVKHVPPPAEDTGGPFRALIFDSLFDPYRGVIVFFRVVDGVLKKGDKVRFLNSKAEHDVTEVGIMQPNQVPVDCLRAGE
eukprot:scaffold37866_cov181-Skeletonema_marinoi.AAC.1